MRLRDLFKETIESLSINAGHLATALLAPFCLLVLAEIIQAGEFDPVVGWAAMLLSLLILPLYIPILIFATSAVSQSQSNLPIDGQLYFLGFILILSLLITPFLSALSLKISLE